MTTAVVKYRIKSADPYLSQFNGQECTPMPEGLRAGASPDVVMFSIPNGGGLYLKKEEVEQIIVVAA